ncbi:hypothetical protein FBQ95_17105 [Chloroflexi bacterium CFX3]|nr:hypothetical protein [Chloroflexi bacterium CFX3]
MPDYWTSLMFDQAVVAFGVYVENKLEERDDKGVRKHNLEDILGIKPKRSARSDADALRDFLNRMQG